MAPSRTNRFFSRVEAFKGSRNVALENSTINTAQTMTIHNHPPKGDIDVAEWLTEINFKAIQNDIYAKSTSGTGTWFLQCSEFKDWIIKSRGVLWGIGIPGAGKTVLSSIVVKHLQSISSSDTAVVFAYCRYMDQYNTQDILASLLKQLAQNHTFILKIVAEFFTVHRKDKTQPKEGELLEILSRSMSLLSKVYVVLDALDEFPEKHRYSLIKNLKSLKCCLFLTSRELVSSDNLVADSVVIPIMADNEDIERFVNEKFEQGGRLVSLLRRDGSIKNNILVKVQKKSRGMFLVAALQLEYLAANAVSMNDLLSALEDLPEGINNMYNATLDRIHQQSEKDVFLAKRALIWVTYAFGSVSVQELQEALAVKTGNLSFSEGDIPPIDILVTVCCGLITIDNENNSVRLAHFTARDFLKSFQLHPTLPHPHAYIAYTCVSYLAIYKIFEQEITNAQQLDDYLESKSLLSYAHSNWGRHMCENRSVYQRGDPLLEFLLGVNKYPWKYFKMDTRVDFLDPLQFVACFGISDALQHLDTHCKPTSTFQNTALHLGARYGHALVVEKLLVICDHVVMNAINVDHETALIQASQYGHEAVVKLLLSGNGTDVNASNEFGQTALFVASELGHDDVVKLLVSSNDIDINATDDNEQSALIIASEWGEEGVVKLLLSCDDIDVNSSGKDGQTALIVASDTGHDGVVKLLISYNDIDVNATDDNGQTALILASESGLDNVVKLLLSCDGLDVNASRDSGETALLLASVNNYDKVVELLISYDDIDVNTRDEDGTTALIQASWDGYEIVVKHLLSCDGIDVNASDRNGQTALIMATKLSNVTVVGLLISYDGIDVNAIDNDGLTALIWASVIQCEAVVGLLLSCCGVDVNAKDNNGRTALLDASHRGNVAIVTLLLSSEGIDVNMSDTDGDTSLIRASVSGVGAVVELLLSSNAINVNARDENGLTSLIWASFSGFDSIVKLLLSYSGTDVNAKNNDEKTALHVASLRGNVAIVTLLLSSNVTDINAGDSDGSTALHMASCMNHDIIVKLLVSRSGINVNASDKDGNTALILACKPGNDNVVKLLLACDGIDVNACDNDGKSAFNWAFQKLGNDHAVVTMLQVYLAKDRVRNETSCHSASMCCNVCWEWLLPRALYSKFGRPGR